MTNMLKALQAANLVRHVYTPVWIPLEGDRTVGLSIPNNRSLIARDIQNRHARIDSVIQSSTGFRARIVPA